LLDRVSNALSVGLAIISSTLVVMIMLIVTLDVGRRSIGLGSIRGGSELAEVLLVAAAFLALAYAQRVQAHVGTSLLTDRLPASVAHRIEGVGLLLITGLFAWMTYETAGRAWQSFQVGETRFGVRQVTVWPSRAAVALGLAALTLEVGLAALARLRGQRTNSDATKAPHHEPDPEAR